MTTPTKDTPLKACSDAFEDFFRWRCWSTALAENSEIYVCYRTAIAWDAWKRSWQTRADAPKIADDFYNGTIEDGLAIIEASFKRLQEQGVKSNYGITSAAINQIRIAATNPTPPITGDRQAKHTPQEVAAFISKEGKFAFMDARDNQWLTVTMPYEMVSDLEATPLTSPVPREVVEAAQCVKSYIQSDDRKGQLNYSDLFLMVDHVLGAGDKTSCCDVDFTPYGLCSDCGADTIKSIALLGGKDGG